MEKLKNLVHYICHKCNGTGTLGAIKLNKVLWHCDFLSFISHGKSMTNETYKKLQHGPVPAHILAVLQVLGNEGKVTVHKVPYHGYFKTDYISYQEPDLSQFTADEISLVDDMISYVCCENTAKSISEITHDDVWKAAEIGEEIPLAAMLMSQLGEITEDDIAWAKQQAA